MVANIGKCEDRLSDSEEDVFCLHMPVHWTWIFVFTVCCDKRERDKNRNISFIFIL